MKEPLKNITLAMAATSLLFISSHGWSFSESGPDDFPLTQISDDFAGTDYFLMGLDVAYNPVFDEYLLAYNAWITGEQDIYVQRVDGQGQRLGGALNISNNANGTNDTRDASRAPSIAVDPETGGYLIAFATHDSGTVQGKTVIYATRLSHNLDHVGTQRVSVHSADDNPDMDAYDPAAAWVGGENPWRVAWSGERLVAGAPDPEHGVWEIWLAGLNADGERVLLINPDYPLGDLLVENARIAQQGPDDDRDYRAVIPRLIPATNPAGDTNHLWLGWLGTAAATDDEGAVVDLAEEVYVMPIGLGGAKLAQPRRVSPYATAPNPEVNAFDLAWSQTLQTLAVTWSTNDNNVSDIPDAVDQEQAQLGLALATLEDGELNITATHQALEFLPGNVPSVVGGPQSQMKDNRLRVVYQAHVVPDGVGDGMAGLVEEEIMMTEVELSSSTSFGAATHKVISRIGEDGDGDSLIPFGAIDWDTVINPMVALASGASDAVGDTFLTVWGAEQEAAGPDEVYGQFIYSEPPAADEGPLMDEEPIASEDPADDQPTADEQPTGEQPVTGGSQNPPRRSGGGGGSTDLLLLMFLALGALWRARPAS